VSQIVVYFLASVPCEVGWIQNPINKSCIKLFTGRNTAEAKAYCQQLDSSLAIFDTDFSREWFIHLRTTSPGIIGNFRRL